MRAAHPPKNRCPQITQIDPDLIAIGIAIGIAIAIAIDGQGDGLIPLILPLFLPLFAAAVCCSCPTHQIAGPKLKFPPRFHD